MAVLIEEAVIWVLQRHAPLVSALGGVGAIAYQVAPKAGEQYLVVNLIDDQEPLGLNREKLPAKAQFQLDIYAKQKAAKITLVPLLQAALDFQGDADGIYIQRIDDDGRNPSFDDDPAMFKDSIDISVTYSR